MQDINRDSLTDLPSRFVLMDEFKSLKIDNFSI